MSLDHYSTVYSQSFSEGKNRVTGSIFRKWNLKDAEGSEYSKIVQDDFESPVIEGDDVRLVFNQNGQFKNLVEVIKTSAEAIKSTKKATKTAEKPSETTKTTATTANTTYKDNSQGQRNGMITGRAVELAIARGETDLEGMQQAALDVKELADFVEKQAQL